jgi:hypothetical protein
MSTDQNAQQPGLLEAIQAAGAKAMQTAADRLSPGTILSEVGQEATQLFNHGRSELAAALFRNTDAYVMYMKGTGNEQEQGHGLSAEASVQQPQQDKGQQQERGGLGR